MKKIITALLFLLVAITTMESCKKTADVVIAPEEIHFNYTSRGTYQITNDPATIFHLPVGITAVPSEDKTVSFEITSPSGAVAGTHYTVASNTVTIAAGQSTANIDIKGIYSQYISGRKDTLIITLKQGSTKVYEGNNTFSLLLRGPCFDGDVTITDMLGAYPNSTDPDDPVYTATVTNVEMLTATTGKAKIANLWDAFIPLEIQFDWTDPANTTVNIPLQQTNLNYAAGKPIYLRSSPGKLNKFSVCNQSITLTVDILVFNHPSAGQFAFYAQNYSMLIRK